jgi:membrane protease YdiL (CAAX protease family)
MTDAPGRFDPNRELRVALGLAFGVLALLTAVKPLGGIPYVGPIAFTIAAVVQLYLPLWRIDTLQLGHDFIGLHTRAWRRDMAIVGVLILVTFPPYIVGHYVFMTQLHDWLVQWGWPDLARYVPRLHLNLHLPSGLDGWWAATLWLGEMVATHGLGVALPEETFYRGYLQPRLEHRWVPRRSWLGVKIGWAAVLATALFASGHFLGEWNPLRLGPFIPGLVFAWQRNATGSVLGAITYHAACNLIGEILSTQYTPG